MAYLKFSVSNTNFRSIQYFAHKNIYIFVITWYICFIPQHTNCKSVNYFGYSEGLTFTTTSELKHRHVQPYPNCRTAAALLLTVYMIQIYIFTKMYNKQYLSRTLVSWLLNKYISKQILTAYTKSKKLSEILQQYLYITNIPHMQHHTTLTYVNITKYYWLESCNLHWS
jgi:hypothetical protein